MDLMSRSSSSPTAQHQTASGGHSKKSGPNGMSYMFLTLAASLAILLSAVALFAAYNNNGSSGGESKYVNSKEYQAVFLSNGQVYFGKVKTLNSKVVVIDDVFYIEAQSTTATTTSNNNYTLRKLGTSELHAPEDRMVINRDQVTFWENIKDNGQVVTKIKEYKANPNASNQVQSNSNGATTNQATPTANQNSTNNNATPKKP